MKNAFISLIYCYGSLYKKIVPPPSADFIGQAHISGMAAYRERYEQSIENPKEFWSSVAKELHWFKAWDTVLDASNAPFYQWFVNGQTNICPIVSSDCRIGKSG